MLYRSKRALITGDPKQLRHIFFVERLAGVVVDLLLKNGDSILGIDLLGTGVEQGEAIPVAKSLILIRSGVPLLPIRIDKWFHRGAEVPVFLRQFSLESKESNR